MLELPVTPPFSSAAATFDDILLLPSYEAAFGVPLSADDDPLQLTGVRVAPPVVTETSFAARLEQARQTVAREADSIPLQERFLLVTLGGELYALGLEFVSEISRPLPVTPLPHLPAWLLGIVNLRGDVLSVLDAPAFWGRPSLTPPVRPRLVVVRGRQRTLRTALLVDQVREMCRFTASQIQSPAVRDAPNYVTGQTQYQGQNVKFLDLNRLLQSSRNRHA